MTRKGRPDGRPSPLVRSESAELLELDAVPGLLEFALQLLSLVALDALLDGLGGLVHEGLGLLEAQAGRRADDLDHLDLLVAGSGQDDVDRGGLLLGRGAVAASAGRRGRRDRGRADAELLLERLDALGELEHGDALELLDPISSAGGHGYLLLFVVSLSGCGRFLGALGGFLGGSRLFGRVGVLAGGLGRVLWPRPAVAPR